MTMTPIYPAHCVPCLSKRECQSLPHSNNCVALRRVPVVLGEMMSAQELADAGVPPVVVEVKPCTK